MTENNGTVNLDDLWRKLDAACQKLWQEDKVAAIPLQAVADEVKIGFRHAEQVLTSLKHNADEQAALLAEEYRARYEAKISGFERQAAASQARISQLEQDLARANKHVETLLGQLEAKETENSEFREKYLKVEVQRDSERAKQVESLVADLEAKERQREAHWLQRHETLEGDARRRQDQLEAEYQRLLEDLKSRALDLEEGYLKKEGILRDLQRQLQTELQSREAKLKDHEATLKTQAEALAAHGQELERAYAQKRADLEKLKADLRAEISELTRHYKPAA